MSSKSRLWCPNNSSRFETAFCVSIEARERTTTGISAADRAATVLAAIDPATKPADLVRPGHIFPLRARNAGVLVRAGQTEAAVDLARLGGPSSRRRYLRDHERGWLDGPGARTPRVCPSPQHPAGHSRRPDQLSVADGLGGRARSLGKPPN